MKYYELEGQVSEITYEMRGGFRLIFKCFGTEDTFTLSEGPVKVEIGSVINCLITPTEHGKWLIHQLRISDQVMYSSPVFVAGQEDIVCTSNAASFNFEAVISQIKDIELKLIEYLKSEPERLREMHPDAFEKLIAEIFSSNGYQCEWTGRSRKTAADVLAIRRTEFLGIEERYIIECKRNSATNKVGLEVARSLYGALTDERHSGGFLVTTSFFESGVHTFANSKWNFHIKDYHDLTKWIEEYLPRKDGMLYLGNPNLP